VLRVPLAYWEQVAKRFFVADDKIRYVGIVDRGFRVLYSENRPGVSSLIPIDTERNFISIVPRILVEGAEKLEQQCGLMTGLQIQYKKIILTIHSVGEYVVVLSFEPSVETPFLNRINQLVQRIVGGGS
jgi:hypothetical protein